MVEQMDERTPTSTRLSDSDRYLIGQAVLVMKRAGRRDYSMSDVLREGGLERAKRILDEDAKTRDGLEAGA